MSPLLPKASTKLNCSSSPRRYDDDYEVCKYTMTSTSTSTTTTTMKDTEMEMNMEEEGDGMSSPLVSNTSALTTKSHNSSSSEKENNNTAKSTTFSRRCSSSSSSVLTQSAPSPAKRHHSRVMSGTELSPLKILSRKRSSDEARIEEESATATTAKTNTASVAHGSGNSMGPPPLRNARKISLPETRFPVKVGGTVGGGDESDGSYRRRGMVVEPRQTSLEVAMRRNANLERAIGIFEDDDDDDEDDKGDARNGCFGSEEKKGPEGGKAEEEGDSMMGDDGVGADDTMVSTFSAFSAIPDMTTFANLRQQSCSPKKSSGPSSLRIREEGGDNTTNLLLDFTDSMRHPRRSPDKRSMIIGGGGTLPSSMTVPNLGVAATPNRATASLIDFDMPPLPTPRSIPTISARELESLKSGFLSEICSLKASLSGKEAEVESLKRAVGDAEKRVGESLERLREEKAEREEWERRGREVEAVAERLRGERREGERMAEEAGKRREAAEMMLQEAESRIAALRSGGRACVCGNSGGDGKQKSAEQTSSKEVEAAVERVARELHALYKGKHETKVTALKKSYEARWEKRTRELERRVSELSEENLTLRRQPTLAEPTPDQKKKKEEEEASRDRATMRELGATVERLEAVLGTVRADNEVLRTSLERERVEKGELVRLAEEMMAMQEGAPTAVEDDVGGPGHGEVKTPAKRPLSLQQQIPSSTSTTKTPGRRMSLEKRGAKVSGLRAPVASSMYRAAGGGGGGGGRALAGRSGIMSSIEKMGSHRGRGQ